MSGNTFGKKGTTPALVEALAVAGIPLTSSFLARSIFEPDRIALELDYALMRRGLNDDLRSMGNGKRRIARLKKIERLAGDLSKQLEHIGIDRDDIPSSDALMQPLLSAVIEAQALLVSLQQSGRANRPMVDRARPGQEASVDLLCRIAAGEVVEQGDDGSTTTSKPVVLRKGGTTDDSYRLLCRKFAEVVLTVAGDPISSEALRKASRSRSKRA